MNLFSEIVDRFDYMKINKIPISDIAHEKGFEIIDTIGKNEYFRAILSPDGVNKFILLSNHMNTVWHLTIN